MPVVAGEEVGCGASGDDLGEHERRPGSPGGGFGGLMPSSVWWVASDANDDAGPGRRRTALQEPFAANG